MNPDHPGRPVALITGAARRIGASIARHLHAAGYDLLLHHRDSVQQAAALAAELEARRPGSVRLARADLGDRDAPGQLVEEALAHAGRLDALVHNASSYFRTPLGEASQAQWDALFDANARAPFFLSQAAAPALRRSGGAIVSLLDIYAERPLLGHPLYCMAKAAQRMMVYSLARELGPEVRVNGVAPGNVLWSEHAVKAETPAMVEERTALRRQGQPEDIADAVSWLLSARYVTGQVLAVDGGRRLFI